MEPGLLGPQLRALRTAAGRTVASVAADAGLSVPYIANLENGRGNPTLTALRRLAAALGCGLTVTLTPAAGAAPGGPARPAEVPASLVRFARTARYRRAVASMAAARGSEPAELGRRLIPVLAAAAGVLGTELSDPDWGRVLDALLLTATHPLSDPGREQDRQPPALRSRAGSRPESRPAGG